MTSNALERMSMTQAARAIATGACTSEALVRACLARIEEREPMVRAWSALDADGAIAQARALDSGPRRGLLHGVPIGVKDVISTFDFPTQMGSPIYEGFRSRGEASCVAMARNAGAVILGKTVTCEFAGVAPGPTCNPLDFSRTPGGSSSGSAAAVADFMTHLGFATQTGGSILRPASFCGVVGYKPTYGTVNREGLKFAAESLDTIGVIVRAVEDAALAHAVLTGRSELKLERCSHPPRIGLCKTYLWDAKASQETKDCVERAGEAARLAGASVVSFHLPARFSRLTQARETINDVERARALAWEWSHRKDLLSPALCDTIDKGLATPEHIYRDALKFAESARKELDELIADFDCLIAPCVNGEAPVGLHYAGDPSLQGLWTLLRVPSMTIPAGRGPNRMPVGLQIFAPRGADARLFALAAWLQGSAGLIMEPAT